VCREIYGAASVSFATPALNRIKLAEQHGMASFPVCIAKTQFSFSADQTKYGAADGFAIQIRDVVLNAGAEMIVALAGDIIRMPGLPKSPQANRIDYVNGEIIGLS
jgi:formate--tetrahydrofolate ligase